MTMKKHTEKNTYLIVLKILALYDLQWVHLFPSKVQHWYQSKVPTLQSSEKPIIEFSLALSAHRLFGSFEFVFYVLLSCSVLFDTETKMNNFLKLFFFDITSLFALLNFLINMKCFSPMRFLI
ncbi:hypothetical protein AMTRI_Chr09g37640 [Amborella trichopoda]